MEQPKVAPVFVLTLLIQVKDFVLLALQKYRKKLYQCPPLLYLIAIVLSCSLRVESQRKRLRAEQKSGAKRRGRPRKNESTSESLFTQEEEAQALDAPAVEVVPEPGEVQTSGPLISSVAVGNDTLELQPLLADATFLPVLPPVQSPSSIEPILTPPPPVSSAPVLVSPSFLFPAPSVVPDVAPVPAQAQELPPVPDAVVVSALPQEPIPAAPPIVPTQLETLSTESQSKETLDEVLIEDLGPDVEEDVVSTQETRVDDDPSEVPSNTAQEQTKISSFTSLSTLSLPQEYLPGN